ncbi:hypothetical protein BESB_026850 [Besnoitia besnoiti]|uniref:Uncharacterized protein n=1 Tax=Besnoitia besnoiti TaxID=94643 RepID=A0A2A9M5W8_BESBE|nr:uncharacterized protein BESB_026850 [Besnoitia besnoiti]PFH31711.1 hypothetical protein BESB_026850 [Besnoitia besnoiti]
MKVPEKSSFIFGKARQSLLLPRDFNAGGQSKSPIRWMTVDFVSTAEAEKLEVDVHAFLFTHDGEYIDCIFYKNPTLAGKGVRLQGTTLYLDLYALPARAGFVVVTLAVYSGGTLTDLTKCCTQVRAYIPKDPLAASKPASAGSFPSPTDHWEAILATMDITASVIGQAADAKGMLNCLLVEEDGSWFLKALLQPVAAFTPHALIESAQRATRRYRFAVAHDKDTFAVPLGELLEAAQEGKQMRLERDTGEVDDAELDMQLGEFERLQGLDGAGSPSARYRGNQKGADDTRRGIFDRFGGKRDDETASAGGGSTPSRLPRDLSVGESDDEGSGGRTAASARRDPTQKGRSGGSLGTDDDDMDEHQRQLEELQKQGTLDILREFMEPSEMGAGSTEGAETDSRESSLNGFGFERTRFGAGASGRGKGDLTGSGRRVSWDDISESDRARLLSVRDSRLRELVDEKFQKDREWTEGVNRRLEMLERGLADVTRAVQQVADGTKEMNVKVQKWFAVTAAQLDKLQRGDGAPGPDPNFLASLETRLHSMERDAEERADNRGSVGRQLRDIDHRMTIGERYQQQISQTLAELKIQLAGVERRLGGITPASTGEKPAVPQLVVDEIVVADGRSRWSHPLLTEDEEEEGDETEQEEAQTPRRPWRCCYCCAKKPASRASREACAGSAGHEGTPSGRATRGLSDSGDAGSRSKDLPELLSTTEAVLKKAEKIDRYGEELGDLIRCLASSTAPDGLKGLNSIERKLLAFAGTPQTFEALHTFESALDRLRVTGAGLPDSPALY